MSLFGKSTSVMKSGILCVAMLASHSVLAEEGSTPDVDAVKKQITAGIQKSIPSVEITSVNETPMAGIYQVEMSNGELVYANGDGSYLMAGQLFELKPGLPPSNLTEQWKGRQRVGLLEGLDNKDMVVFSPEKEVKSVVYAFTDVDCGYCQKLHAEIPEMNELGIEVRYLAWPRAGLNSPTGKKMAAVWCSEDRKEAMTKAKRRLAVGEPPEDCKTPINDQIALGHKMGVRGTPALFMADGTHAGGYLKAADLARRLGIKVENTQAKAEAKEH